jgi:putative oxidoreductase
MYKLMELTFRKVLPNTSPELRPWSLLLLRVSLGLLMLIWGVDKLVNIEHGMLVSERFYLGAFSIPALLKAFGAVQMVLGFFILLGLFGRWMYPVLISITAVTLIAVWRSIVDPWGWYLEGANALFFPSLIIFAGALVLLAFRDLDTFSLDARSAARERRRGQLRQNS